MAKPGDNFLDIYTAGWYNKVDKAVNRIVGVGSHQDAPNNQYVTVYNHSTTPREIWEAVSLGTPKLNYEVPLENGAVNDFAFVTKDLTSSDPHNIAILQEPLAGEVNATARALICGSSWLRLSPTLSSGGSGSSSSVLPNTSFTLLAISDLDEIDYSSTGRIEVLRSFEYSLDEYIALVVIGKLQSPIAFRFQLTEALNAGTAEAIIYTMEGVSLGVQTLKDPEGVFASLGSGNRGYCLQQDNFFYPYNAKCAEDQ